MVLPFVANRIEVPDRIVEFGVDDVEQRRDLREIRRQMVQQRGDPLPVVLAEHHDHHHLARRSRADDHVAHQPPVFAGVVERVAVFDAEASGLGADVIRRIGLKPALVDVQHLVEHVGNMESERGRGIEVRPALHLFARQPAAVGEGEFELVAVKPGLLRPQTGRDLRQCDLADARQLVAHLLGLEAQLFLVGQVLPLAAPANPEMGAEGLRAQRRFSDVADHESLHEPAALGAYLHIHHIARNGQRHEHHHVVPASHRLAFGGERRYFKPLDEGIICLFASHRLPICGKDSAS